MERGGEIERGGKVAIKERSGGGGARKSKWGGDGRQKECVWGELDTEEVGGGGGGGARQRCGVF